MNKQRQLKQTRSLNNRKSRNKLNREVLYPLKTKMTDTHTGFVLTRSSVSRYGRTELEYWLATDFGPVL